MSGESRRHSRLIAIFASGTLFSRVLGMVRDMVWVTVPLASRETFLFAFQLPNMLRDMIGEGATNAAIIPVLAESREEDSEEEFKSLISASMSAMLVVLGVITALGVAILPYILPPGLAWFRRFSVGEAFDPERANEVVFIACWTFPYLFMIGMAAYMMGPLFTLRRYAVPSWAPALLNAAFIVTALGFQDRFADPAHALVLGAWLGGMAQLIVHYIALGRASGVWWPNFRIGHPRVRTMLFLLLPVIAGQSAGEINKLVNALFAMGLEEGTVNALFYANRLIQLPLSVFGVAVSVAILPSIAQSAARGRNDEILATLAYGLRQSFFLVVPAMVGLAVLGEPIVRLLFERGHNTPADTAMTYTATVYYGAGLLSFAWLKVIVSGFYAVKDTRTPVIIATICVLANVAMNFVLVGPMGYRGLALSTTVAYTLNFALLLVFASQRFGVLVNAGLLRALMRMALATAVMGLSAYGIYWCAIAGFPGTSLIAQLLQVFLPLLTAVAVYFGAGYALNIPECREFLVALRRRMPVE